MVKVVFKDQAKAANGFSKLREAPKKKIHGSIVEGASTVGSFQSIFYFVLQHSTLKQHLVHTLLLVASLFCNLRKWRHVFVCSKVKSPGMGWDWVGYLGAE